MSSKSLSDYPALRQFLSEECAATVAVPIDEAGTIHVASLVYWHTESPLRFHFVTGKDTEKCRLLTQKGEITAACVVGTIVGTPFTLQMRGVLTILDASKYKDLTEKYYQKRGNRHDDINDPSTVLLAFAPSWARFTDYAKGYDHYFLSL